MGEEPEVNLHEAYVSVDGEWKLFDMLTPEELVQFLTEQTKRTDES